MNKLFFHVAATQGASFPSSADRFVHAFAVNVQQALAVPARWHAARRRRHDERALLALDPQVLSDIGAPLASQAAAQARREAEAFSLRLLQLGAGRAGAPW